MRPIRTRRYCRANTCRRLQVGGGKHLLEGWLNGDLIGGEIYLNACRRLPLADATLDRVFAEQFIEHLDYEDAKTFLNEAFRVLKPGGSIRLATPDLEKLVALYRGENAEVMADEALARHRRNHSRPAPTTACFLNDLFRLWGHQFIFDFETLRSILLAAGFGDVERVTFGNSEDPHFKGLERHADVEWMKNAIQLIVEAQKPSEADDV